MLLPNSLTIFPSTVYQVPPREYLETALAPVTSSGRTSRPDVEAKNRLRACIKALFLDRDCFTLVRPVSQERQLHSLEELPPGALRPEFTRVRAARTSCCSKEIILGMLQ